MARRIRKPPQQSVGWRCATCGELITQIEDGWVEWLASEDERNGSRLKGLRLVHSRQSSPRRTITSGCQYDEMREFRRDGSIVEGLSLERFVGPDGLMLLLSLIASGEMPKGDVLELAKRVQIPGYELTRALFRKAIQMGVLTPSIGAGYYLQSEIEELLRWRMEQLRSVQRPAV